MADIRMEVTEAATKLQEIVDSMTAADRLILCRGDGSAVAEVRLIQGSKRSPRKLDVARGEFQLTDSFFEPLPDDLLDAFEGRE
jgi:hypothetical protein